MKSQRRRGTFGGLAIAVVLASAIAPALLAKQGIVKTNEGSTFQGDVTTDDKNVHVTNASGIRTSVDKRNVASIEYVENAAEKFKNELAALAPDDLDGRVKLARAAYEQRRYTDARDALDAALAIDPNNAAASEFRDTVQKQMRLERGATNGTGAAPAVGPVGKPPGGAVPGASTGPAVPPPPGTPPVAANFLKPADINSIRQLEWRQDDVNVRVRLKGDVKKRFVSVNALEPKEFNSKSVVEQAWEILRSQNPDMAKDVEVMSDPGALAEFRRPAVQGKILAGCAAAGCHGPNGAGGFMLMTTGENEAVAYTNFYILQKYRKSIGGRVSAMVDRATPEQSLLLQYGLPPDIAEIDHPAVNGYRGIFRNKTDPTYRAIDNWMRSLSIVEPDYKIEFALPTTRPAPAGTTTAPTAPVAPPATPAR